MSRRTENFNARSNGYAEYPLSTREVPTYLTSTRRHITWDAFPKWMNARGQSSSLSWGPLLHIHSSMSKACWLLVMHPVSPSNRRRNPGNENSSHDCATVKRMTQSRWLSRNPTSELHPHSGWTVNGNIFGEPISSDPSFTWTTSSLFSNFLRITAIEKWDLNSSTINGLSYTRNFSI